VINGDATFSSVGHHTTTVELEVETIGFNSDGDGTKVYIRFDVCRRGRKKT